MTRTCKKCGREIVKNENGFWRDLTPFLPFYCNNWTWHKPKKKKATCKYCGRIITKKGKKWLDQTKIDRTKCCNDIFNIKRKHKPAK
jgi:hypothetical protein